MKKIWPLLFLGIAIRLLISSTTFHPDIKAFNLAGYVISTGSILNLYDYLPNLSAGDPLKNIAVFNYPPAVYWFSGSFNFLFSNIFNFKFINEFITQSPLPNVNILFNLHLLLLKLPYLIPDLLIGFVLLKMFKAKQNLILALWMFNPIHLYSTYMMGQFDIIPTFFIVLSLYYVSKNKMYLAALSLGGGIAFKIFPIFLILPLMLLGKNVKERAIVLGLSLLPYILSITPYIGSQNFRSTALLASQTDKGLYAVLPVSGGEAILLFPFFLLFFYLILMKQKLILWKSYFIVLSLFFILTHYHPQWLIWLTPFLIIDLNLPGVKNIIPTLLILGSWFLSLFFFDPSLTIGLFAPVWPNLHNSSSIWDLFNLTINYNLSRSIIQTIFAAALGFLIYRHCLKNEA